MHIDAVKDEVGDDAVLIFRSGIHFLDFKLQCPLRGIFHIGTVAHGVHVEILQRAAVFQFQQPVRLVIIVHQQGFYPGVVAPCFLALDMAVQDGDRCDARIVAGKRERQILADAVAVGGPHALEVKIVRVHRAVGETALRSKAPRCRQRVHSTAAVPTAPLIIQCAKDTNIADGVKVNLSLIHQLGKMLIFRHGHVGHGVNRYRLKPLDIGRQFPTRRTMSMMACHLERHQCPGQQYQSKNLLHHRSVNLVSIQQYLSTRKVIHKTPQSQKNVCYFRIWSNRG